MGTLKQARYLRENNENAKITVFYIDIRTIGREEKFYYDLLEDENISFVKGKVAKISETSDNNVMLDVHDTMSRDNLHEEFDMAVLATGVVPNTIDADIPLDLKYDEYGFVDGSTDINGVFAVGCAKRPCDVSRSTKDSTGAALKAIQYINGRT
jgi:quinone-modifying oxidoreductase subunit QmoA